MKSMSDSLLIITPMLIALIAVSVMHPYIVKIARLTGIVDNPNARKLQKEPVPILGGVVVYFGICLSVACVYGLRDCSSLFMVFSAMMLMLYTGTMDDILDLRPATRFLMQILAVGLLIFSGDYGLDNLHGLWGISALPQSVMIPLTVFAGVGIINALNLIDGVDGLSTGFCIMACTCFGVVFYLGGVNQPAMILAMATIGSLIPFFLHNVFGKKSKMFIGDGGTLLMGIVMSVFVMKTIQSEGVTNLLNDNGYSSIAFTLAVLALPVFDTLRVMSARMLKHKSPFHPDKTHLHHLFIEMGYSHVVTSILIISLNALVVLLWLLLGYLGATPEVQVYAVAFTGLLFTAGLYYSVKRLQHRSPKRFKRLVESNRSVRLRRVGGFLTLQKWIDRI